MRYYDVDVDIERKQAQAIASFPDSITQLLCLPPPMRISGDSYAVAMGTVMPLTGAMRRFDSRRHQDSESLQEFEQALRLLHREVWPTKTPEQRDSELKRRFVERLSNTEMAHYLRLHARDCDFTATVLKACQYADTAESIRPKKSVRILKKTDSRGSSRG